MSNNVEKTQAALDEVKAVSKKVRKALSEEQRARKAKADKARREAAKQARVASVTREPRKLTIVVTGDDTCPHCKKQLVHSKNERRPRKICKKKSCQRAAAALSSARYRARLRAEGGVVKVQTSVAPRHVRVVKKAARKRSRK